MYIRPVHAELDLEVLYAFIRLYPLGLMTTGIPHPTISTLQTTHIPFLLDTPSNGPATLRGHMARANPQAKAILASLPPSPPSSSSTLSDELTLLFQAPVNHYVTPKFYTATKPETGKVVPTWNYAAVQVYGHATIYHTGTEAEKFLQRQIEDLSAQQEEAAGHERVWRVTDAPEKYVGLLKKAIIGFEIEVERVEGRWKMSQEMGDGDWKGVVEGFKGLGTKEGEEMAKLVQSRGEHRQVK